MRMRRRDWLVSAAVAGLCMAILTLFTDFEESVRDWVKCPAALVPGERPPECR
ncbi:MAG: hypothetical protein ACK40D_14410 [Cyanobacteriota bacterium]|jgi:hypothetical protein